MRFEYSVNTSVEAAKQTVERSAKKYWLVCGMVWFYPRAVIKKNLYELHVFVCTNKRENGKECCADKGSVELRDQLKTWAKEKYGKRVRINSSGCMDCCSQGIATVIYPHGEWHLEISVDQMGQNNLEE